VYRRVLRVVVRGMFGGSASLLIIEERAVLDR
jgi:hypothetical protein